jgi:hypothetical protein
MPANMSDDYYHHPNRFHKNVPGPFYTTGTKEMGDCLSCDLPEGEAPDLLAELNDSNLDTYFVKQPETPDEIQRACSAIRVCCVAALRYGGKDAEIIKNLGNRPEHSDYFVNWRGRVVLRHK